VLVVNVTTFGRSKLALIGSSMARLLTDGAGQYHWGFHFDYFAQQMMTDHFYKYWR
jgi:hypothetical protein